MEKIKILMLGKPGGSLARTYNWHIQALNSDKLKRFDVDDINIVSNNFSKNVDVNNYDIFWFYAKAFQPGLYENLRKIKPNSKIICGPNILLDKPDIGLSDEWDNWYANKAKPDMHLDQVSFYSNHVKKFLCTETKKVTHVLDKCIRIDNSHFDSNCEKEYDCLLYSKKRRYDYDFETFRSNLIKLLEENNIKYCEVKAGKFGKYERKEYFKLLNQSKIMVNLSLDECPGILNYESMFFNVPVIGSPHNVPVNSDTFFHVLDTDMMTEKYLVRKKDADFKYFKKIKETLDANAINNVDHRSFVLNHTSFEKYANEVHKLVEAL